MWSNFYENGGWGMYPTTLFGFFLVASTVLLLLRPERRFARLTGALGLLTLFAGVLGCSVGFINTFRYVENVVPEEQVKLIAIGCAESLNNVVLALLIVTFCSLLAAIAALRVLRNGSPQGSAG